MSSLTWLHLSDWHHRDFPIDPEEVRDDLVRDIKERSSISRDLEKIDFVVFSGDAAYDGKAEEYEDVKKEFFERILEAAGDVSPRRLFIVPGNHDLDKTELEKLPEEFLNEAPTKEEVDKWLKDDLKREQLLRPFKDFRSFVSGYTGQDSPDYSNIRTIEVNGKAVSLLGVNSAWFCRRHFDKQGKPKDYGFLRVGKRQIHRPLEQISKSDFRIAVLHHSQQWLEYFDGQDVWNRLRKDCHFILHGHGHKPEVTAERGTKGDCVIIPAGASFKEAPTKNSYNFVHLDLESGKGTVFLRCWNGSGWTRDYLTYPDGKFCFDLPGQERMEPPPPPAPHRISPPPRCFVGRKKEIEGILHHFEAGAVIVQGMGGMGKTALALVLADKLAGLYPDGQIMLEMKGTDANPLSASEAMAQIIRVYDPMFKPEKEEDLKGRYFEILNGKRTLLLLDNAASREQIEPLLPPKRCALLVTSRNRFALKDLKQVDLDVLPLEDAEKLLLKIAARIGENASELAKLCGCLPIALENAAYALLESRNLGVADYMKRLKDASKRLELVEASFTLSYELLTPELQRLWSMLSVFPADFDLAGAAAVWEMEEVPAEDALGKLIRWSLVDFLPDAQGEGGRYRLHDLARDFAESRLDEAAREAARLRHAEHYREVLSFANEIFMQGKDGTLKGLQLFDQERANILSGQSWAEKNLEANSSAAIDLCKSYPNAGVYVLDLRISPRERIPWLKTALQACRKSNDKAIEVSHLGNLGNIYFYLGESRKAIEYYEKILAIHHEIGDRQGEESDLSNLGISYVNLGEFEKAVDFQEQALKISLEIGDRRGEGNFLGNLGNAYFGRGELERAIGFYQQAIKILKEIGDRRGEGVHMCNLGCACIQLGEFRKGIVICKQALKISQGIGDRRSEEIALGNLGNAYLELCEPYKAIQYYDHALKISIEIGDLISQGRLLFNMGLSLEKLGERDKATDLAASALQIFEQIESHFAEDVRKQLAEWSA